MDTITHDFRQEQEESLNDHAYKIDDHTCPITENDQKGYNSFDSAKELDKFGPICLF